MKKTKQINHRKLLDGIFAIAGVPPEKFRTVSSSVDKLDKEEWKDVKKELVTEKGISPQIADKIWDFVQLKGQPKQLLQDITSQNLFVSNADAVKGVEEMKLLFTYLENYQCLDKVSIYLGFLHQIYSFLSKFEFDLSLARGLDYYTGVIYEAVLVDGRKIFLLLFKHNFC